MSHITIRKLKAEDCDSLFEMLTKTFENKYQRPVHFDRQQPKMWVRDSEHMRKHIGIFEDGRLVSAVGIYPLPLVIDGEEFKFFTTGNVATLPGHEGKGYFSLLFDMAMYELELEDADGARLGGARQRYARFGFEGGGLLYKFTVMAENVRATKPNLEGLSLVRVEREDIDALRYCHGMMEKKEVYVERGTEEGYRDMYLGLITKSNTPYLVLRGEERVGYLCLNAEMNVISEYAADSAEELYNAVCYLQKSTGNKEVFITVPPYEEEELRLFSERADSCTLLTPSRFKLLNYERITSALLRLKAKKTRLPEFDFTLGIEHYGRIRLYSREGAVGCEKTDCEPALTVTATEAIRLLFSYTPTELIGELPAELRAALPLPLSWATLDYV